MPRRSFIEKEYGLKKPPFKRKVPKALDLQAWVNREEELKRWNKVLSDATEVPDSNFLVFIIGDYGMGKTLSLLRVVEEANKRKGTFCTAYLSLLSEERPKTPGLDFLQRVFKSVDFEVLKVKKHDVNLLQKQFPDVGNLYNEIFFSKDENKKNLAISLLTGETKPSQTQLRDMGMIRKIDRVDTAKEFFIGMLYLMKASGFSTLVLAIDEFEYLFSLVPKPSQSVYLALLRGLFDILVDVPNDLQNKITNMVFFIGVSRDGFRRLTDLEKTEVATGGPIQPLMRRVTDRVSLEGLDKRDAFKLIEKRLSLDRIKGRYEDEPLIPFSKDFVNYVYKLSVGRPSDIMDRCDCVLDSGLEQRVPRLTAKFAREVFKEKGFIYE